jgi:cation diffusion facilitator CzcD-associated flavoprotein CzcO
VYSSTTGVAIIGAGPNGLALAAHLRRRGIEHRIFGSPMQTWRDLPKGMSLKSLGFASTIPMPGAQTFPEYCRSRGLEDYEPIEFETLAEYGLQLQREFVPHVEDTRVSRLDRAEADYVLTLEAGERVHARRVVVAIGLGYFPCIPAPLDALPSERVTHTWGHKDFESFAGKDVVVVGGGSSALENAVLLHEHGARVRVVARSNVWFALRGPREWERGLIDRIRVPISTLGHGRENWVLEHVPWLMHFLPAHKRLAFTRTHLGPFSGWWLRDRADGQFPIHRHTALIDAKLENERLRLRVNEQGVGEHEIMADHVIAGTGYEVDLNRVPFLTPQLTRSIRLWDRMPRLDRHFESSVPGLFFIGPIAAESFGPLVRFIAGTEFTVSVLGKHLARNSGWLGFLSRRPRPATARLARPAEPQLQDARAAGQG